MTATFDPTLAAPKDRIRQRIGETTTTAIVQDETIAAYLATGMSELQAAHRLCLDLAAYWAKFATTTLDDQQQRSENIHKHYLALAKELERELDRASPSSISTGSISVGGIGDCRGPIDQSPTSPFYTGLPWDRP